MSIKLEREKIRLAHERFKLEKLKNKNSEWNSESISERTNEEEEVETSEDLRDGDT